MRITRMLRLASIVIVALFVVAGSVDAQRSRKPAQKKTGAAVKKKTATTKKAKGKSAEKAKKGKSKGKASDQRAEKRKKGDRRDAARGRRTTSTPARAQRQPARKPVPPATASRPRPAPTQPQARAPQPAPAETGPVDLAQQTAEGRGGRNTARSRRAAPPIPPLSADQLRAINNDGPETESIGLRGYPDAERQRSTRPFYAEGSLGLYATGSIRAGYHGNSWPYDYSAQLGFSGTNGFVDNGSQQSLQLGARGGYIIGNEYGIFSGGYMGADVKYERERYQRFAALGAPERSRSGWMAALDGRNSNAGLSFELNGGYRQMSLEDSGTTEETSLDGSARVRAEWSRLAITGEADLRLTNLAGTSLSYGRLRAFARYTFPLVTLRLGATLGVGANNDGTSASVLAPLAEVNVFPFRGVTLAAGIDGGVAQNTLRELLASNPWVVADPVVRHREERIGYRAAIRVEPWQTFGARLTAGRSAYDNYAVFARATNAQFAPGYAAVTSTRVAGDMFLEFGPRDMIAVQATYHDATLDSSGGQAPYVPALEAEAMYVKRIEDLPLTITGTIRYVGERDDETGTTLAGAVLLGVKGRYALTRNITATLELANLANARYELWPGYRERGFFGAVGVAASF